MGCCGCDNKSSTLTAAIFGIIQSGFAIILTSYNIDKFNNPSAFDNNLLPEVLITRTDEVKALLVVNLLLHLAWLGSSIILLIANMINLVWGVRQWQIITIIVIILDFILPSVVAGLTMSLLFDYLDAIQKTAGSLPSRFYKVPGYYFLLLWCFTKGGLITWIANICFCVFSGRRIQEILHPNTGYVITSVPIGMPIQMIGQTGPQQTLYTQQQQGYVVQQGYVQQPQLYAQQNQQLLYTQQQFNTQPQQFNTQQQQHSQLYTQQQINTQPQQFNTQEQQSQLYTQQQFNNKQQLHSQQPPPSLYTQDPETEKRSE